MKIIKRNVVIDGRPRHVEEIAIAVLREAMSHCDPDVCSFGDVMAVELAILAASMIDTCPKCGATAWVNIDCDLCSLIDNILNWKDYMTLEADDESYGERDQGT